MNKKPKQTPKKVIKTPLKKVTKKTAKKQLKKITTKPKTKKKVTKKTNINDQYMIINPETNTERNVTVVNNNLRFQEETKILQEQEIFENKESNNLYKNGYERIGEIYNEAIEKITDIATTEAIEEMRRNTEKQINDQLAGRQIKPFIKKEKQSLWSRFINFFK